MVTTPFLEETARRRAELRRSMWLAGLPRTLTAEEANTEFDFDVPLEEGWSLKLTRDETVEEGFSYSFLDPEGWELFPDDTRISPTGERYSNIVFNEAGEAIDYTVTTPEGETYTLADIRALPIEPLPPPEPPPEPPIEPLPEEEARIVSLIADVFPDMTPEKFVTFITEDWRGFTERIIAGGPTAESVALLRQMGFPQEEIDNLFKPWFERLPSEGIDIVMEIAGIRTLVHIESPNLQVWAKGILIGNFDIKGEFHPSPKGLSEYLAENYIEPPQASKDEITKDYKKLVVDIDKEFADIADWTVAGWQARREANPERVQEWLDAQAKAWDDYQEELRPPWEKYFTAGTGDVISAAAGVTRWMGEDGIADRLTKYAEKLQAQAPPDYMGEFEWSMMLNPRFYSTRVLRALPFTLSLAPAAIVGAYISTHIPVISPFIATHLGTYGNLILASIGGATFSRPLESAFEAGITYDEAIARGMTKEQADKAALDVFLGNLVLGGWDAAQFAIAFIPIQGAPTASRFWKMAMVGGKLTIVALTEAGEEAYQEVMNRWALDEEVKLDAEMQQVMAIGGIFGFGLGGVGEVFTRIKDATLENLTPEGRATFDGDVARFEAEGLTREQAELRAFDELAKTEEGGIATSDAVERVKREGFDAEAARYREIIEAREVPEVKVPAEVPAVPEVVTSVVPDVGKKQTWQMTEVEYDNYVSSLQKLQARGLTEKFTTRMAKASDELTRIQGGRTHRWQIETALAEGKAVPVEVLAEYPDLKPPAVEVAKPPIEHRGTEPEGIAIADELGLRYDGIQEELGMQFTDVAETGTSFYARTVEEARTTLADKRTAFARPPVERPVVVEKPSGLTIETTKQDTFIEASVGEDASRTTQDAIEAQSDAANVPPPIIPPGTVGHIEAGGNNPDNAVYDMTNRVIPGEDAGRAAVRLWSGTRKRMATETISWWKKGSQVLRKKGIGKADGDIQRLTKEDSYELFKALHGEADVPAELQDVYDELKLLLDQESSDMLAFDPSFSRVMMAHPDYFPRGWRPPTAEQAGRMRIGVKPGFLKPRIDATFTEMVESGWEPISWNPYDMAALRRMAGTEYREGRILISRLKTFSKAIAARDAPIKGWRVPQVGPAFQGKPYVGGDGKAYMTPRMAVPDRVADVLESVYGVPVEFRVAGVNIFKALTAFGALTKRVKLFGSLFQHVDFLTRDLITAFTPEGIRHAEPLKFPALAARVTASAVSPSWRATLEARILSGEPLYSDSTITLKMVADAGWELGQDELLIRRDVREQLESIIKETPGWEEVRWAVRRLGALPRFFEAGLFDGVYRESQAYALEHVIIPRLRRLHPTWTDEQIAGSAAEEVNKQFSTLAVWQSVLQQPAAREFARAIFFSFNESESWIRQATSAVKGKNARYWREYAIATFVALAIAANAINLLSERKFLPLNRYVPISLGNSYSSMPWGIAYNSSFLSPRLPWNGRNGQPIYLDIVGQADTYLRWMLDPLGALTARYNVLPRALMNQVNGRDFWGRELEDWDDRVKQVLIDLFAPIGAGNLLQVARLQWPPVGEIIPEAEGRIGIVGSFIQISGLNVRSEKTMDMLDRFAKESGLLKADGTPVETWNDLEPHQKKEFSKNEDLQTELGLRGEAAVERQYPGAEGFAKLDELDQERITRGESLIAELMDDLTAPDIDRTEKFDISRTFRNEVTRLKREIADRKAQVDKDFQLFQETGVLPDDPNQRALTEYYNIFEKAKKPSGVIDWDEVNRLEEELREKWTPEQESYVDRNIGLTEWGPLLQEFLDVQKTLSDSGYWDADERDRKVFRYQHPEVENILTGKFYNYKPIEKGAEQISLEWYDIYRQIDDMETGFKEQSNEAINALPPMEGVTSKDWAKMSDDEKRDALIDHEMELIYAENPGFWEADQKRDAWRKGFVEGDEDTEGFVDTYLERAIIVRATSPMSAEAKLFMLDHSEFFKRGLDLEIWTDDGSEWNRSVLELQAKHRTLFEEYELLETDEERQALKDANPQWVDDMRRIEAYENDAPEDIVEKWVERGKKIDEFEAGSSEALVWLLDNPDAYDWAIENKLLEDRKAELLEREPILRINVEFATNDDWYNEGIPDKYKGIEDRTQRDAAIAKERAEYLVVNTEYNRARYRRDAFGLKDKDFKPFPDELVETYVDYYVLPKKPDDWPENVAYYEDEWFLQDNPEFHQALVDFGIFKELKDVSEGKVPTREIFEKWWVYNTFTTQYDRDAYRLENPDLDEWGVNVAKPPKWARTMSERRRRARITPSERFLEDVAEASQKLKDIMAGLGEELR